MKNSASAVIKNGPRHFLLKKKQIFSLVVFGKNKSPLNLKLKEKIGCLKMGKIPLFVMSNAKWIKFLFGKNLGIIN